MVKIAPNKIENIIKNPPSEYIAYLIYGPDEGLVRERAKTIALSVVDDLQDPFNVVDLNSANIAEDPAIIADEIGAISMMGGRRLIRIRDGDNKIADILKSTFEVTDNSDNIVIVEAGDLKASSKLRKVFENLKNAAAIPCYVEDAKDLSRVIATKFTENNIKIEPEALAKLASMLVGDRIMAMNAVEKIITYIGNDRNAVSMEDVIACAEDSSELFMSDLIKSCLKGDIVKSDFLLKRLLSEGIVPVAICRAIYNYLDRIAIAKTYIENGDSIDSAIQKLRPPVFWKEKAEFRANLNLWPISEIIRLQKHVMKEEASLKETTISANLIIDRLIFNIAKRASTLKNKITRVA